MKALFTRKTIVIAAVAALIAITAIISVNVFDSAGPVTFLANLVSEPFKALATSVARTFESIYSSIYRYDDLVAKYDEKIKELTDTQRDYSESEQLRRDNDALRALFGFSERHADHVLEEADVSKWSSNNFTSSFIINKGYSNSLTPIAKGNSVITASGVLIGQITDVGAISSTVTSVLDTTFAAGVYVGNSGSFATAKGDFTLMNSGMLVIDYLDDDFIVLPGDSVTTSSSGGIFPVGLVIGNVEEVLEHSTGIGRYATVRPMRAIDSTILKVYVITSFDIAG